MTVRAHAAALIVLLGWIGAAEGNALAAPLKLKVGQEWSIKSASPTTAKVIIDRIEPWHSKTVVQISVIDVPIPQGAPGAGGTITINHMPFEKSSLSRSVDELLATDVRPPSGFESGYKKWRADKKAGIYTISVARAVELIFATFSHGRG